MSGNQRGTTNASIAAATALLLLGVYLTGDLIPVRGGVGYDGAQYAHWARHLSVETLLEIRDDPKQARKRGILIDDYSVRRVLPPLLVHHALGGLGIERTPPNVVAAFQAANAMALVLAAWLLCLAGDAVGLSRLGKWIGAIALIVSHANTKLPLFYPCLTDSFAVAIGAGSVWAWATRRNAVLAGISVVGAFAWPTSTYFAFLLLALPRASVQTAAPAPRRLDRMAAATVAIVAFGFIESLLATVEEMPSSAPPLASLVHGSALITSVYLYLGVRQLLADRAVWSGLRPLPILRRPWFFAACAIVAGTELAVRALSPMPSRLPPLLFVQFTFYTSVIAPGVFMLAHALYFGPLTLFLITLWPRVCRIIRAEGLGMLACFGLALVLSVSAESRRLINFYPFVAFMLARTLDTVPLRAVHVAGFAALSFFFSKAWLSMADGARVPLLGDASFRELFVSSRGQWLTPEWYWAQLAITAAVGIGVVWFGRRRFRDDLSPGSA